MSYKEFIDNILNTRGRFACGDEYKERHHIIPRCMGGTNDKDNLIDLYAREHFEAHRLLALENKNEKGLQYAWWCMCNWKSNKHNRTNISYDEYEEARINYSKMLKKQLIGSNNPMYGKSHSEEIREKMREKSKGRKQSKETVAKRVKKITGQKRSEESKAKMRESQKLKVVTEETKRKISESSKGRIVTEETRRKISESNKGRIVSKDTRIKISMRMNGINNPMYGKCGKLNPFFGKHHTEETKNKLSKARSKAVKCIETNIVYTSALIAQEKLNICSKSIGRVCNGKQKTAGGYHWEFV